MSRKTGKKGAHPSKRGASPPRWRMPSSCPPPLRRLSASERLNILMARLHHPVPPHVPAQSTAPLPRPDRTGRHLSLLRGAAEAVLTVLVGPPARAAKSLIPSQGPLARVLRFIATPGVRLAAGFKAAFAPVTAEGDRSRGAQAFHGPARVVTKAGPDIPEPEARTIIAEAMAQVPGKGDPTLPEDLSSLAFLLGDPPPRDDFKASDLVRDCFAAHGSMGLQNRALLAVAIRLTAEFGLPSRLPLTSARAWRMLDPILFEDEMAAQLDAIDSFIGEWQKSQQSFLVLEFGEIELIEWLFEALHPARHAALMAQVMNFKVLSNRRQGILRRIPHRVRKFVKDCGGPSPEAISYAVGTRAFLERVSTHGYLPIADTAAACLEEVDKLLEKLRPPPVPEGAEQQAALARITPVKMPASELAAAAMAGSGPPPARPQAPPQGQAPLQNQISPAVAPPPRPPVRPQPTATPAAAAPPDANLPADIRPATVRLQARHMRPGAVLTIPSRSASRIPLGRLFSAGERPEGGVAAISVKSSQTRPGRPARLPAPVNAVIPPSLPAPAAPSSPRPATTGTLGHATGRISLPIPGRPAVVTPTAATARPPVQATGRVAPPRPTVPPPPAPPAAIAPAAPASAVAPTVTNVTKLTMVPKRRLPITQNLKRQSVLRVLRGEDIDAIAQSIGISRNKLDDWVDKFVTAGAGALTAAPRKRKAEELTVDTLRAKLAEVLATAQMIEKVMESSLPRRPVLLPPQETPPHRPRKKQG